MSSDNIPPNDDRERLGDDNDDGGPPPNDYDDQDGDEGAEGDGEFFEGFEPNDDENGTDDGEDDDYYNNEGVKETDGVKSSSLSEEEALVKCGTTKGDVTMQFYRKWSPNGYDRAVMLFEKGFYDETHFFRVVPNFLVQFGITYSSDEKLRKYHFDTIPDDPQLSPRIPFEPGVISFAGNGPNSRSSQLFISYGSAKSLGTQLWETPLGRVTSGLEHVQAFYADYGDMPPWGHGPEQHLIRSQGLKYMSENFSNMDRFLKCKVERTSPKKEKTTANAAVLPERHNAVRRSQEIGSPPKNEDNNAAAAAAAEKNTVKATSATLPVITSAQADPSSLPLPALAAGVVLCGLVLLFFLRMMTKQSKPPAKVTLWEYFEDEDHDELDIDKEQERLILAQKKYKKLKQQQNDQHYRTFSTGTVTTVDSSETHDPPIREISFISL